jgi:hypothetical protein
LCELTIQSALTAAALKRWHAVFNSLQSLLDEPDTSDEFTQSLLDKFQTVEDLFTQDKGVPFPEAALQRLLQQQVGHSIWPAGTAVVVDNDTVCDQQCKHCDKLLFASCRMLDCKQYVLLACCTSVLSSLSAPSWLQQSAGASMLGHA